MSDLGPFHNRAAEWELYQPLIGDSMLELGCKINAPFTYKAFFAYLGYRHVSVDINGMHGSLKMDLREPLNLGTFDMVANIGTSEHVSEHDWTGQTGCWRNIMGAMHMGSVLICTLPMPGQWPWHGCWYPHEDFYRKLGLLNGLELERMYVSGEEPRKMILTRMKKLVEKPFGMPAESMVFRNRR